MLRKLFSFGAALLIAALAPAQAGAFSALYSFGDSLSDVGNLYNATGLPPSPPYSPGRFSNGANWVDDLSARLGLGSVTPSGLSGLGGNDYAWGYATTGNGPTDNLLPLPTVPTGDQQVQLYLAVHGGHADPQGLYTFTLGSNDLFNILGGVSPTEVANAAAAEAGEIQRLATAGARTFIIALVPDLGLTPFVQGLGPGVPAYASSLAFAYDAALQGDLAGLAGSLHGGLHFLDTYTWLDRAVGNPAAFGLTDATHPCFDASTGTVCGSPDTHLFWDSVHPTAAVDDMLAAIAAPSPTPGAGLVGLAALALAGIYARTRRA